MSTFVPFSIESHAGPRNEQGLWGQSRSLDVQNVTSTGLSFNKITFDRMGEIKKPDDALGGFKVTIIPDGNNSRDEAVYVRVNYGSGATGVQLEVQIIAARPMSFNVPGSYIAVDVAAVCGGAPPSPKRTVGVAVQAFSSSLKYPPTRFLKAFSLGAGATFTTDVNKLGIKAVQVISIDPISGVQQTYRLEFLSYAGFGNIFMGVITNGATQGFVRIPDDATQISITNNTAAATLINIAYEIEL